MIRLLRKIPTAASLLLALALGALWVRSHFVADVVMRSTTGGRHQEVATVPGMVRITAASGWIGLQPITWYRGRISADVPILGQTAMWRTDRVLPLDLIVSDRTGRVWIPGDHPRAAAISYRVVNVPLALPLFVVLVFPVTSILLAKRRKRRDRRRAAGGLCVACGYDLRASDGRCPECGRDCHAPVGG